MGGRKEIDKNNLFQALFTKSQRVKLIIEPETGKIVEANESACKYYGYLYEELVTMNINQINILSNDNIKQEMMNAKASVKNRFYFKHKLKSGDIRDVEVNSVIIVLEKKEYLYSDIQDITEQFAEEQLLIKARKRQELNENRLKDRLKILNAIHSIGLLTEKNDNIEEICTEIVNRIAPKSMQFPEKAMVLLEIANKKYHNFENNSMVDSSKFLSAPIFTFKKQIGIIKMAYSDDSSLLLEYEQKLVNILAQRISKIIEIVESRKILEESEGRILESGLKFKTLTDNSFDIMSVLDANGIILFESKATKRILGYKAGERIGKTAFDFVHPDDLKLVHAEFIQLASIEKSHKVLTFRFKHKNGSWKLLESSAQNFLSNPFIGGIIINSRDISEQKKAEHDLRVSEEKYRLIAENVSDVIWILNVSNKKYTYISPSIHSLRGLTVEEAMSESFDGGLTQESKDIVFKHLKENTLKFKENPEAVSQKIFRHELQHYNKFKEIVWIESVTRFRYNKKGEIEIVGVSRKIDERKKQEQKILHRLKYEESISLCSSALLQRNDGALNKTIKYILEGTEVSRVYIFENFIDGDNNLSMRQTHEVCAENVQPEIDNPLLQHLRYEKDGFKRWEEILKKNKILSGNVSDFPIPERKILEAESIKSILAIPIWVNKEWYGFIGFDDVKEERKWNTEDLNLLKTVAEMLGLYLENNQKEAMIVKSNKELELLNATKDKFLSIVAHDLKSPFASILGFSELLVKNIAKYEKEKILKFVNAILDSSRSAYKLVENLLEWARSQAGKIEFNPGEFNLKSAVLEAIFIFENAAKAKEIKLICKVDQELVAYADKNMLNTIIRNLISNAIKFTHKKGTVIIDAKKSEHEIEVFVIDNGVGLSDETIGKLFKINEKVSVPGTEQEKGTGLGLLLCKEFIDKHKGKIKVDSVLDKGSTFTFTLPFEN